MEINKIYNEDCLVGLRKMGDGVADCCVTSPPYYGLRDYGVDGQIGLEESPEGYVGRMVEVFGEVRRVLKDGGTLWLNLGDSYNGNKKGNTDVNKNPNVVTDTFEKKLWGGAKNKDLIGIPWMVAFALRSSGWYLRQDIIWSKGNPMPESVTDRCTKSHEYVFLLSKSAKYHYDNEAIKEGLSDVNRKNFQSGRRSNGLNKDRNDNDLGERSRGVIYENKNKRSVWNVNTKSFRDAHFATFPEELIVDMIKAGCPEGGLVLDPFMGAGTTAVVAKKLGRDFIGFELNKDYVGIAEKRLYKEFGMFM